MTDLEKLVRWIDEAADITPVSHGGQISYYLDSEKIADHLLSHGVTVKEQQKPMTVEELEPEIVCWYEERNDNPHPVEIGGITSFIQLYFIGGDCPLEEKKWEYGKTWRCWAEKPTESERKNAEWEN